MTKPQYGKIQFLRIALLLAFASSSALAGTAEQGTYIRQVKSGMEYLKAGDYHSARDAFTEAVRYNDRDAAAHLGLGLACFHLHDDNKAERELAQAALLDPGSWVPFRWLGELAYRQDDLEAAVSFWQKAVDRNPSDQHLRERLDRMRREQRTEKDFNRDVTSHFLVKYEGREKIEAGRIILRTLEDAYSKIGRDLGYYPDREIQVILYSSRQFKEVTDAPDWSGGVYDGKIRMPIGGIEQVTPGLRRLLFHEYTHAVVHAITPRCPTWLNEGLAQYFEGRGFEGEKKDALRKVAQAGKLPLLMGLEGSFMGLDGGKATIAYLLSFSAVDYMVDNFGMYRVKGVLDELAVGAGIGDAVERALSLSYDDFDRGWKKSLE